MRELLLCGDTSVRSTDLRRFISKSKESGFKHQFEVRWYAWTSIYVCTYVFYTVYLFYIQLLDHLTADSVDSKKVTEQMDKVRYMDRLPGAWLQVAVILFSTVHALILRMLPFATTFSVQGKHVYVPTAAGTVFYNASHVDVSYGKLLLTRLNLVYFIRFRLMCIAVTDSQGRLSGTWFEWANIFCLHGIL